VQKWTNSKRYVFQADAVGVGGQLTHPSQETIPFQGSSALPPAGGFSSGRVNGFRHSKDILSYGSAYTEAVGTEPEEGVFEQLALSVVEKFNLLDVVTCDRIVTRLSGTFPGERSDGSHPEISIVPIGSRFEGLRIGNEFFERLELAPDYFCNPERACWSGLLRAVERDCNNGLSALSLPDANGRPVPLPGPGHTTNLLGFCLAVREPKPGFELGSPVQIKLPHFGTVHLGEYFCDPTSRNLTMLRVDLGCAVGGSVTGGAAIVRGGPYPP
jgi:hypothetical protein